jgi:hypothetical protein
MTIHPDIPRHKNLELNPFKFKKGSPMLLTVMAKIGKIPKRTSGQHLLIYPEFKYPAKIGVIKIVAMNTDPKI